MPQHTRHSLIHILLLWTAVLSIIQLGFIIFFFTGGHHAVQSQTEAQKMLAQSNNTTLQGPGRMLTFQADDGNDNANEDETRIRWLANTPHTKPISQGDKILTVKMDGYYFLSLQVTVCSCQRRHRVSLKWKDEVILQGWINNGSCSTGLLAKAKKLSAPGTLEVTIHPNARVNTTESLTHLDIIYIVESKMGF